jgi:hypothetical protein
VRPGMQSPPIAKGAGYGYGDEPEDTPKSRPLNGELSQVIPGNFVDRMPDCACRFLVIPVDDLAGPI